MMADAMRFWENDDGVHAVSPGMGGEFTLCGWSFDAPETERDGPPTFSVTWRKTVTCPQCVTFIRALRGVRTGCER